MFSELAVDESSLPRLVYVGDVPVEASQHGSALLYRLFNRIPPDRLCVVETNLQRSLPSRRLVGVVYEELSVGWGRLLRTRFHKLAATWYMWRAAELVDELAKLMPCNSQAIVTVAHGFSWLTAARYAELCGLPLHLIIHDDWPHIAQLTWGAECILERRFGEVYRTAASRMCVSPYMVEEYKRRYGVSGALLYPSRAVDAMAFAEPLDRLSDNDRPLVFGFGGTINTGGHVAAMVMLAETLLHVNGALYLYGPLSGADAERAGLARPNVRLCGLVRAEDFIGRLRDECDILFVPMSFSEEDRWNMRLCFPSKLTDYTAAGLPILIYGPPYCSAVRWAESYPGVAEVATDEQGLRESLEKLSCPSYRKRLGERSLQVGEELFSHAAVERQFFSALTAAGSYD